MCLFNKKKKKLEKDRKNRNFIRDEIENLYSHTHSEDISFIENKLNKNKDRNNNITDYHLDLESKICEYIVDFKKLKVQNKGILPSDASEIYVDLFYEMVLHLREITYNLRDREYENLKKGWNLQHLLALAHIKYELCKNTTAKPIYEKEIDDVLKTIERNGVLTALLSEITAAKEANKNLIMDLKDVKNLLKKERERQIRAIEMQIGLDSELEKYKRIKGISNNQNNNGENND